MSDRERKKLANRLQPLYDKIYTIKDAQGIRLSDTFHTLPLRTGTDYYKIVLHPLSLHAVGRKIKKHEYDRAQQFVDDLALISWNARLYNIKDSQVYVHAIILKQYITDVVIPKLRNDKAVFGHKEIIYPHLGALPDDKDEMNVEGVNFDDPYVEPSVTPRATPIEHPYSPYPNAVKPQTYTNDHHQQTPTNYNSNPMIHNNASSKLNTGSPAPYQHSRLSKSLESGIRRGRPPIIDKPFETRIKLILKGFKKLRDPNNESRPLTSHFERVPDSKYYPDYYSIISNPISLNEIKVKVRTRKYNNVDQFINDLTLMFNNARDYFQRNPYSQEYIDYQNFSREANIIIQQEINRPEHELLVSSTSGNDGIVRYPLDSLEVNSYVYKIGDWVLIQNPNDPEKPIVGQIFRLWSTDDGNKYTNICWYYRPEQTCHKHDRLFFMNEVCKTGQYRDHLVNEIVGPCYVVFLTRYQKGDLPDGVIPEGAPWFICEFRYNESTHVFNRIRTWKACLPDEVRDNYEHPLIPLHEPRKLIKYESPIRGLLQQDAYEGMPIPEPTQGNFQNTPPLVGSVYLAPPKPDDDLGQYISSPNVTLLPEHKDVASGRAAYLFTPISQLKGGGGATTAIYATNYSTPMPLSGSTVHDGLVPPINSYGGQDTSYLSGGYKSLQAPNQDIDSYPDPLYQPQYSQVQIPRQDFRKPTTSYSSMNSVQQTGISPYSSLAPGNVLSYALSDQSNLALVSHHLNKKRKLVEGKIEQDIIFYRSPPILTNPNKVITQDGSNFGHSAKYLAWKLNQAKATS